MSDAHNPRLLTEADALADLNGTPRPSAVVAPPVPEPPSVERDHAMRYLKNIKSNLMHQRRFGQDTFGAWRNAAVRAEGDAEEAINTLLIDEATTPQPAAKPAQAEPDTVPKGVLLAITNAGLTLVKTQHGYQLLNIGKAVAQ